MHCIEGINVTYPNYQFQEAVVLENLLAVDKDVHSNVSVVDLLKEVAAEEVAVEEVTVEEEACGVQVLDYEDHPDNSAVAEVEQDWDPCDPLVHVLGKVQDEDFE